MDRNFWWTVTAAVTAISITVALATAMMIGWVMFLPAIFWPAQ